jgi:hypothetical protein
VQSPIAEQPQMPPMHFGPPTAADVQFASDVQPQVLPRHTRPFVVQSTHRPLCAGHVVSLDATHVVPLQQVPLGQLPPSEHDCATHMPPEHMGVAPPQGVPCWSTRHPSGPAAHVTGVLPWQEAPADGQPFVQHCAEPALP